MMRALWSAASGMMAQKTNMDVVANNLANVNTYGYKKQRAEFQDLIYQSIRSAGSTDNGAAYPQSIDVGLGTRLSGTNRIFTQGALQSTGRALDIAIQGQGFFQITLPNGGGTAYTRDGSFKIDSNGQIVTSDGYLLDPAMTLPEGATEDSVVVNQDGVVTASVTTNGVTTVQQLGTIQIAKFTNPTGLQVIGQNLFLETPASGAVQPVTPGQEGMGTLLQKTLEMSGVEIVEEMVGMIVAQRAYDANAKAVTTSDSMLQTANELKR